MSNHETKRIFISYSWSSKDHEDWVLNLATRLRGGFGVDVILDKWDLKEGQDIYDFMESMVTSEEVCRVLIICDQAYSEKANKRKGGVGTETQIISPEVYKNVAQEKFIPIVSERGVSGQAFIPTFLKSRKYIDLSGDENYEQGLDELVRNIYERPLLQKPALGKAPDYLFDDSPAKFQTTHLVRSINYKLEKKPKLANRYLREFLDVFEQEIENFRLKPNFIAPGKVGELMFNNFVEYTPLRNDLVAFIDLLLKSEEFFDCAIFNDFLSKIFAKGKFPADYSESWTEDEFANFKFFTYEIFLYLVSLGIKHNHFKLLENLLTHPYVINNPIRSELAPRFYSDFLYNFEWVSGYWSIQQEKFTFSPMADIMLHFRSPSILKIHFLQADLLCYYISALKPKSNGQPSWLPYTYHYYEQTSFDLIGKLVSISHWKKVNKIFGDWDDHYHLQIRIKEMIDIRYVHIFYKDHGKYVPPLWWFVDVDLIGEHP